MNEKEIKNAALQILKESGIADDEINLPVQSALDHVAYLLEIELLFEIIDENDYNEYNLKLERLRTHLKN